MSAVDRLRIPPGAEVSLAATDPADALGLSREDAAAGLEANLRELAELQYLLYAENRHALLIILQGMDASGKDGVIRHVMTGMNPQGVKVHTFKVPTPQELDHDFLWRVHSAVPPMGEVGVFNRSHYEDVVIVRVKGLVPETVWQARYDQINEFERLLAANDVVILKFFLHISRGEQLARLKARLADPRKQWKIHPRDFEERRLWKQYQQAYEAALARCSTAHAPWFIVPADRKWVRDWAVSQAMVETLRGMRMTYPPPSCDIASIVAE